MVGGVSTDGELMNIHESTLTDIPADSNVAMSINDMFNRTVVKSP
jgi:hypothetical protein